MSQNVLADAQFTLASILRPFEGFEAVYQGQSVFIPIAFPGTLDEDAGRPGFSPYLLKGLPVPMGAKMQLWFPAVAGFAEQQPPEIYDYKYVLIWRLRNVGDFQRNRLPYHLRKESFGAPDTYLAPSDPNRFVLPAATEAVLYQQNEPSAVAPLTTFPGPGLANLRTEQIDVPSDRTEELTSCGLPLLPPNSAPAFANAFPSTGTSTTPLGAYEQGIIDPADSDLAPYALYRPYFTVAKGDELIIACYRNNNIGSSSLLWDFSTTDQQFSNLYGTNAFGSESHKPFPDLGIYVFAGSNPS